MLEVRTEILDVSLDRKNCLDENEPNHIKFIVEILVTDEPETILFPSDYKLKEEREIYISLYDDNAKLKDKEIIEKELLKKSLELGEMMYEEDKKYSLSYFRESIFVSKIKH